MMSISISDVALSHIRASGPVDFKSVLSYTYSQYPEACLPYEVADAITKLIRDGSVKLWDDGETFVSDEGDK